MQRSSDWQRTGEIPNYWWNEAAAVGASEADVRLVRWREHLGELSSPVCLGASLPTRPLLSEKLGIKPVRQDFPLHLNCVA